MRTQLAILLTKLNSLVEVFAICLVGPVLGPHQVEMAVVFEEAETVQILQHSVHAHGRAVFALNKTKTCYSYD